MKRMKIDIEESGKEKSLYWGNRRAGKQSGTFVSCERLTNQLDIIKYMVQRDLSVTPWDWTNVKVKTVKQMRTFYRHSAKMKTGETISNSEQYRIPSPKLAMATQHADDECQWQPQPVLYCYQSYVPSIFYNFSSHLSHMTSYTLIPTTLNPVTL